MSFTTAPFESRQGDVKRSSPPCGELLLFGEEGAPNTEKYPDVSWYCDKCGDYLNLQEGFTDTLGSWKCHRCGYENMIDEEHM